MTQTVSHERREIAIKAVSLPDIPASIYIPPAPPHRSSASRVPIGAGVSHGDKGLGASLNNRPDVDDLIAGRGILNRLEHSNA